MLDPRRSLILVFVLAAIGCGGAETAAGPSEKAGSLRVTILTTGASPDPDGYALELDGGPAQALGSSSTTLMAVPAGEHSVALSGIAPNCEVSGSNPRSVTVEAGATVETVFGISCAPATGNLRLVVSTSGDALDTDGYTLSVSSAFPKNASTSDQVTFTDLDAGSHVVLVTGLAPTCRVDGHNPQRVAVPADSTAEIPIVVLCSAQFGALDIYPTTSLFCRGDPDGVYIAVPGRDPVHVYPGGGVLVSGLDHGQINIVITDIETSSAFGPPPTTPPPPRSMTVGAVVRAGETVRVPVNLC